MGEDRSTLMFLLERFLAGESGVDFSKDAASKIEGEYLRLLRDDDRFDDLGYALACYAGGETLVEPNLYTYSDIKPLVREALELLRADGSASDSHGV